jgi:hypothetical protein
LIAVKDEFAMSRQIFFAATGGRIIPITSANQYAARLARWFGVADGDLSLVAPNLGNFSNQNLGFLG